MDVNALDIFEMAIVLIKVVLLIASFQKVTANIDNTRSADRTNPTDFDIMRETK